MPTPAQANGNTGPERRYTRRGKIKVYGQTGGHLRISLFVFLSREILDSAASVLNRGRGAHSTSDVLECLNHACVLPESERGGKG